MVLDRHIKPPVNPVEVKLPTYPESVTLKNGVTLFLINDGTEDILRADFVLKAGIIREHIPLLASTTNMMLQEGSVNYDAEELNTTLDFYGVFQNLYADRDSSGLKIYFLNKHIEKVLNLIVEMIFRPTFPGRELEILMKKRLNWFRIGRNKVQNLASDQFYESIFGSDHPYGRQIRENDFNEINPDLLKEFHMKFYRPEEMTVILSGRINDKTVDLFSKFFGGLSSDKICVEDEYKLPSGIEKKKRYIEKEDTVQTALRIGSSTINKLNPDYQGLKITNMILGGYFGSRLMKNLREEKGLTYGIHSSLSSLKMSGFKVISAEVRKKDKEQAIDEIYKEIKILQKELVPEDELEIVRNYMSGELVRLFDGPFALAESFKSVWEYGLDYSYFRKFSEKVKNIMPDEILKLANTYYNIDELYEITAG